MPQALWQVMFRRLSRMICVLLACVPLHEGFSNVSEASWIRGPDTVSLAEERSFVPSPKPPYRLVFYDNMRHPVTAENGLPAAVWAHSDFSPLIAVDANPWVGISVFRATSAESALSDRLYANVQLQLILEEYERLQQRAREILEGLGLNLLTSSPATTLSPKALAALGDTLPASSVEEPSLEARLARLRSIYRQAALEEATAIPSEPEALSPLFLAMTGSPSSASPPSTQGGESRKPEAASHAGSGPMTASATSSSEKPPLPEAPPSFGPYYPVARPIQEQVPLPWIFRAGLAMLRFIFTHKTEILAGLFFAFALFLVLAIIFSTRRERL
ncbi:MAG: hypothetical protein WHS46_14610 [Desulfosoma sp.]